MIDAEDIKVKNIDIADVKTVEPIEEGDMKHPLQNR